jgi:hypothetical protein
MENYVCGYSRDKQHVLIYVAASLLRRGTGRNEAFELFGIHYN